MEMELPPTKPVDDEDHDWCAGDLPRPGDIVDEKYLLREQLGRGGMGVVYLADDLRLRRHVAIKLVHPVIAEDESLGEMFQREAESMARLRHPNIVEIYDIGRVASLRYLVMSYHEGDNLTQWLARNDGRLVPVELATVLLTQLCDGLAEMHARDLVHGDLKPSNILVSPSFQVMLVDLGLSRPTWQLGKLKVVGGTPGYMAPELLSQRTVEPGLAHKIDIYALGVTAYGLLTGYMPPSGANRNGPSSFAPGPVTAPSVRRPSLGTAFDAPILQALELDPRARPEATELRKALVAARNAAVASAAVGERPRVVVVDDDESALMLVTEVLRATLTDPEIVQCSDPLEALRLIEHDPPDLVITDLQMPGINGIELTATLRGHPRTTHVPVIVLSGVGGAPDWKVLQALGAGCFLLKPLVPDVLSDVVLRMMRASHHIRARSSVRSGARVDESARGLGD
jgi:eukaryotic-like serine/threonine-protein kinase